MVAAAFGPYVSSSLGIRTEQLAVYGFAVVATLGFIQRPAIHPVIALPLLAWIAYLLVLLSSTLFRPAILNVPSGSALAGLDNALLPLAALMIANRWLTAPYASPATLTRTLVWGIVVLMSLNTLVSVTSSQVALSPLLSHFWSAQSVASGNIAVATLAARLGRFSGIFNQPAEAGLAYSIALLGAVYLFAARSSRPALLALVGGLLIVGGMLTVSKIFLLAGLAVASVQLARYSGRQLRLLIALIAVGVAGWAVLTLHLPWEGQKGLTYLLQPGASNQGLVGFYTAGRFGDQGSVVGGARYVLAASPWLGFGVRGVSSFAYDSTWLEALASGGLLGVAAMVAAYASFAVLWLRSSGFMPVAERRLAGGLILVLTAASLGLPSLTCNRDATLVWLLVPVALATRRQPRLDREAR